MRREARIVLDLQVYADDEPEAHAAAGLALKALEGLDFVRVGYTLHVGPVGEVSEPVAVWVPCQGCDAYWCTIHGQHVFECPCPPIEGWDVSPYGTADQVAEPEP